MVYFGKFRILKTRVTACDYDWAISEVFKNLNEKFIVAPIASHPIVLAYYDKNYQKILNEIKIIAPDSQYVRWSLKFLYGIDLKDRLYGPKLFLRICQQAEGKKKSVYLIGNKIKKLINRLKDIYPNIIVSGFVDLNEETLSEKLIKKVNQKLTMVKPDIIFIGIGSPNQHRLATGMKVNKPIVCVGAAFDFISGNKKQAPKWAQTSGLEWFFRLLYEPERLIVRYIFCGFLFALSIFWQKLKKI